MLSIRHARLFAELVSQKVKQPIGPVFFSFYITNKCNLRCSYCFIHSPDACPKFLKEEFTKEEAFNLLDEAYELGVRMIFLLGGEPLMYPHFGEVVAYIRKKGMVCHVMTNGLLMTKFLDELKLSDGVCVSLDGLDEANDHFRGKGTCKKVLENLKAASDAGIKCRLHAVLNRYNIDKFDKFLKVASDLGTPVTVSPPAYVEQDGSDEFIISEEEQRDFWRRLLAMKDSGLPVGHTRKVLKTMIDWPQSYQTPLTHQAAVTSKGQKIVHCVNAERYCGVDADGTLHFCLHPGMPTGLNVKEVGLSKAWEHLKTLRPKCHACASPNSLEYSTAINLDVQGVANALRYQLLRKY
jgi:MoaA/NifB/PqqE/SkfB family radical SAM enzyme